MIHHTQDSAHNTPHSSRKAALSAFVFYIIWAIVITWPLALHFKTEIVGVGGDDQLFMWNYWWVKHAIMDLKTNPFYTSYIFYPHRTGLFMHALMLLNGLLSIPLQYVMPLPAVFNIFILLSYVLCGFGVYLLAQRLTGDGRAAFIAGFIFASYVSAYMLYANIATAQWVPFYLYFLLKAFDAKDGEPWLKNSLLAGIFLAACFFSDYYHFIGAFFFTLIVLAAYLASKKQRPALLIKRLLPAVFVALPFVLPVALALLKAKGLYAWPDKHLFEQALATNSNVADLAGFFSPATANPIIGKLSFAGLLTGMTPVDKFCYLGITAVFFSIYALKDKLDMKRWMWLAAAVFFLVMAAGPYPHVLGRQLPVPMPFKLFAVSGFLAQLRSPVRFVIYAMLAISVLAATGMARAFGKKPILFPLVLVLALVEYTAFQPVIGCSVPPVYRQIAADKGAQAVLEIPVSVRDGLEWTGEPYPYSYSFYYQTVHGKRLFGGYLSRVPQKTLWSYYNLPIMSTILEIADHNTSRQFLQAAFKTDREAAPYFLDLFGLDYIVVHRIPPGKTTPDMSAIFTEQYLTNVLPLAKIYEDPGLAVYRTIHAPLRQTVVQAGTEPSTMYLYNGWINGQSDGQQGFAWATGKKSILLANMQQPGPNYGLGLELKAFDGTTDKRVDIGINGRYIATLSLNDSWNFYRVNIPAGLIKKGLNRIYFKPRQSAVAASVAMGILRPQFPMPYLAPHYPLYWEQNNAKFNHPRVSFALAWFSIGQTGNN